MLIAFALCNVLVAGLLVLAVRLRKEKQKLDECEVRSGEERRTDEDSSRGDAQSEIELVDVKQKSEQKSIGV